MEVHAHTHTPRKKWTHYFWEFLMLFLAVFCGFLAENFREHQIEHKRTVRYAKQFINEIELDTAQFEDGVQFTNGKLYDTDSLLGALDRKDLKEIYYQALKADDYYIAKFHSATFEQIKNSGYLRNFRSDSLITAIQDYINLRENVEIVQDALSTFYNQQLTPFLNKNVDRQYQLKGNYRRRVVFDSIWMRSGKEHDKLIDQPEVIMEFRNLIIGLRTSFYLGGLYKILTIKSVMLITLLKKEFDIK